MSVTLKTMCELLDETLKPHLFKDYAPNGLQVEGNHSVKKIISGVTASEALIDQAIAEKADALLVHHGYFWRGENPCMVGMKKTRIQKLLKANMSLIAYHLPLDAHPVLGNNQQLGELLNFTIEGLIEQNSRSIALIGNIANGKSISITALAQHIETKLSRKPLVISGGDFEIKTVGWCTGAAQDDIEIAAANQLNAFISGEISERTVHIAKECGIHYFAAGHHATERYGVKALGQWLEEKLSITHSFIDIDNPV